MHIYEKHSFDDIRLPFIIHTVSGFTDKEETMGNWHENLEIVFIIGGSGKFHINETYYNVSAGDIIVVNQNRIHSFLSEDNLTFSYIIIDRSFCISNYFDTNTIVFDEFIQDNGLFEILADTVAAFEEKESREYSLQYIRAQILRILVLLCRHYSRKEAHPTDNTNLLSCIKQAIGYIHSESSKNITLESLAKKVGLSKYYFEKKFKSITGYTPIKYLNMVRCDKAMFLLKSTDKSIGTISMECGFYDQSYFTKVFKSHMGVLPTEVKGNL